MESIYGFTVLPEMSEADCTIPLSGSHNKLACHCPPVLCEAGEDPERMLPVRLPCLHGEVARNSLALPARFSYGLYAHLTRFAAILHCTGVKVCYSLCKSVLEAFNMHS
jgi:hypothetical protein